MILFKWKNNKEINIESNKKKAKFSKWVFACLFIVLGILLILLSIIFKIAPPVCLINPKALDIIVELLSHIGTGLLVLGLISLIIEREHWTEYFEERLSKIVTEKKYLENLDPDALTNLQTEVLKAYFKNDKIGGIDGFLNYYQKNIQTFIGSPFRTNVNFNLQIAYSDETKSKLEVHETFSWLCNSNGGKIQEYVRYEPDTSEFEKVTNLEVILEHDNLKSIENLDAKINFSFDNLKQRNLTIKNNMGFLLPLTEYSNLDKLRVEVKATYIIAKERFIAWGMAYPTRGVTITVQYPTDLKIVREFYFHQNNSPSESSSKHSGQYYLYIHDWLMPDEGITFQLINKIID